MPVVSQYNINCCTHSYFSERKAIEISMHFNVGPYSAYLQPIQYSNDHSYLYEPHLYITIKNNIFLIGRWIWNNAEMGWILKTSISIDNKYLKNIIVYVNNYISNHSPDVNLWK
jgi:hypothetical protein